MKRLTYPFSVTKVTANHFLFTLFIIILSIDCSYVFSQSISSVYVTQPVATATPSPHKCSAQTFKILETQIGNETVFIYEENTNDEVKTDCITDAPEINITDTQMPQKLTTTEGYSGSYLDSKDTTNMSLNDIIKYAYNKARKVTPLPELYCPECQFACHSKHFCIEPHLVCDGINDCDDGSDELSCPTFNDPTFDCTNGECPLSYKRGPGQCYCSSEMKDKPCQYEEANAPQIIFSTDHELYAADLPLGRAKIYVHEPFIANLMWIKAFDYRLYDGLFIWLDWNTINTGRVHFRINHLNGIYGHQVAFWDPKVSEFAFDWMNSTLFWTFGNSVKKIDQLFTFPINKPELIVEGNHSTYRAITIDVMKRCIFWLNADTLTRSKSIERIDIGRKPGITRIVGTGLLSPVGLAVDTENVKLYWIDGLKGTLNSVAYDGTNRITLYNNLPFMGRVISMDIFSNYLYFTNNINNTIDRININGAVSKVDTLLSVPKGSPTYVKIVHH